MAFSSLTRLLSFPITTKTTRICTLHFTTSVSDTLYTHLQNNPKTLESFLNSINPKLDSNSVIDILNRCSIDNSQLGLRFFVWAGAANHHQSSYRHSPYMYVKACSLLKIRKNPQLVLDLVEGYRLDRCFVSVKTFKVLLNLCRECGIAEEALLLLRKMSEFGLRPDSNAYNVVIRLFCVKGDVVVAEKLMGEMGLVGLYPDMITYISVIRGLCDVGRMEEGYGLLKEMRRHGCLPNLVVYSAVIDGFCRNGRVERALELLEEMEKEGGDCSPNVVTCTSIIQSFCEKGRTMEALQVLDRMETFGIAPNRVTVSTLIRGLCVNNQLEEAYKLVDKVSLGGGVSYGVCVSCLVVSLIRINNVDEAEKLFRRVIATRVSPDGLACNLMIKQLCSDNRAVDAFSLYDEMDKMGCCFRLGSDTYSILLVELCQQSHPMEAAKLAKLMLEKKIQLKQSYSDKLVKYLKEFGDKELVVRLENIVR